MSDAAGSRGHGSSTKLRRTELYERLVETARQHFDRVDEESGDFKGGICRVRNETTLLINRHAKLDRKLRTVATALADLELDQHYMLPALRDAVDRYAER